MKYVPPTVGETAFNCPHCGTLTSQSWFSGYGANLKKNATPTIVGDEELERIRAYKFDDEDNAQKALKWAEKMILQAPFFEVSDDISTSLEVHNLSLSSCYHCGEISIWVYNRMLYPQRGEAPQANPDLSKDIRRDYDEASSILDLSPRGAAALIRLAIQKLCKELGKPGKNINEDIASLVADGLSSRIQKALDIVRVTGNDAVHPGTIDLRDDLATAERLFQLLNLIAEKMISEEKHVNEMYEALPEEKRKAIEKRDRKTD